MPFLVFRRIICGPHQGIFAVRDHVPFNLGTISGLGIICGRGSFGALYSCFFRSAHTRQFLCLSFLEHYARSSTVTTVTIDLLLNKSAY